MPKPRLGRALRRARTSAKLSLKTVAEEVHASFQYVSKLELDEATPSLVMLHRLDRVLRLPDHVLLGYIRYGLCPERPERPS